MNGNLATVRYAGRVIAFLPCPSCEESWSDETETWSTIYTRIDPGKTFAICPNGHESEVPPSRLMELNRVPRLVEVNDEPS